MAHVTCKDRLCGLKQDMPFHILTASKNDQIIVFLWKIQENMLKCPSKAKESLCAVSIPSWLCCQALNARGKSRLKGGWAPEEDSGSLPKRYKWIILIKRRMPCLSSWASFSDTCWKREKIWRGSGGLSEPGHIIHCHLVNRNSCEMATLKGWAGFIRRFLKVNQFSSQMWPFVPVLVAYRFR